MAYPVFKKNGIREIELAMDDESVSYLKSSWKDHVKNITPYPENKYNGKGIVMCAGGVKYFTCAWIAIKQLRKTGCKLPIELWFLGKELSGEVILQLGTLNVVCKNFRDYVPTKLNGVMLKPLAIIHSQFKDILFLDADNNCLKDPAYLLDTEEYLHYGAIFWPDFWKTAADNPIWQIVESTDYSTHEQESGQLVINKQRCWTELNLSLFFNENHVIYHELLLGDKDTFRFAWLALKSRFFMIEKEVAACGFVKNNKFIGTTMVQHSIQGDMLFFHRNLLKWDVTEPGEIVWEKVKEFKVNAVLKEFNCLMYMMDLSGDVLEYDVPDIVKDMEEFCLVTLEELRLSNFYTRFLIYTHISGQRTTYKLY